MAHKRTHFYRGHAIAHHVFATDETHEKIEQFLITKPGKPGQVASTTTLESAKASIDEIVKTKERLVTASA